MTPAAWKAWPALSLPLAADARLHRVDAGDDQIWQLTVGDAVSGALQLYTQYGLRARSMRIFPLFRFPGQLAAHPGPFDGEVHVEAYYPNYARLQLAAQGQVETIMEYWVPSGQVIAGQVTFFNTAKQTLQVQWQMGAELQPFAGGARLEAGKIGGAEILHGRSAGLVPVLFLTGGASASDSPYSALGLELDIAPGQTRRFTWVHAALRSADESFRLARHSAARDWPAEMGRIEMHNQSRLEIETGDPGWNAALALSQAFGAGLLHGPSEHLPHLTAVEARRPQHGYSPAASGADYHQQWLGQSVIHSWYWLEFGLPGETAVAEGLLRNFLATQQEDGRIDAKPGLGGYRSYSMAMPLLADIAWRIYEVNEDMEYLKEVFGALVRFHFAWFDDHQDRDGDGLPEWANAVQMGFEDHPIFSPWHEWSQGADIRRFRSPLLLGLLYQQAGHLLRMAELLGEGEPVPRLREQMDAAGQALKETWQARRARYRNLDAETLTAGRGQRLAAGQGPASVQPDLNLPRPARLLLRLSPIDREQGPFEISISGRDGAGRRASEKITAGQLRWGDDLASASSDNTYTRLERVRIKGLAAGTRWALSSTDLSAHDITLLAPLYAGVPDGAAAERMIKGWIMDPRHYGRPFGMPSFLPSGKKDERASRAVCNPWVVMALRGMLKYGKRDEAAAVLTGIMKAAAQMIETHGEFRRCHDSESGAGSGEGNHIAGLPPVGVFLDILGVKLISPWKVALEGHNPFPWPVRIRFRGLQIERGFAETRITFPDGRSASVDDPAPCTVDARAGEV